MALFVLLLCASDPAFCIIYRLMEPAVHLDVLVSVLRCLVANIYIRLNDKNYHSYLWLAYAARFGFLSTKFAIVLAPLEVSVDSVAGLLLELLIGHV